VSRRDLARAIWDAIRPALDRAPAESRYTPADEIGELIRMFRGDVLLTVTHEPSCTGPACTCVPSTTWVPITDDAAGGES
jgi:hypothetical protein